ncbi:MAG: UDP-N-acetylglucosamine 2-epimerase (non-hydrolyzing) [Parcubacteria group bacterium]
MKIILVAGARPNFMKIAPLFAPMKAHSEIEPMLLHTGQHYDFAMSDVFFTDLNLPKPDIFLGVGSASHAEQTAKIMIAFEKSCLEHKPDVIVVVGDVNSTLACAIVAAKLNIKIAHIEAGLRSWDRTMPEEINRIVTDSLSDFLFTHCEDANENLRKEGIADEKIHFVGNVMIDTLLKFKNIAAGSSKIKLSQPDYVLVTLHRPSNVDDKETFEKILTALLKISESIPVLFTSHPRTKKMIEFFNYQKYFNYIDLEQNSNLILGNAVNYINPLPYLEFLNLMSHAKFILTDSGGIQEETTILNIPCLTLRKNTERPVTVREGTNELVGIETDDIIRHGMNALNNKWKTGQAPKMWDGKASERIIEILLNR